MKNLTFVLFLSMLLSTISVAHLKKPSTLANRINTVFRMFSVSKFVDNYTPSKYAKNIMDEKQEVSTLSVKVQLCRECVSAVLDHLGFKEDTIAKVNAAKVSMIMDSMDLFVAIAKGAKQGTELSKLRTTIPDLCDEATMTANVGNSANVKDAVDFIKDTIHPGSIQNMLRKEVNSGEKTKQNEPAPETETKITTTSKTNQESNPLPPPDTETKSTTTSNTNNQTEPTTENPPTNGKRKNNKVSQENLGNPTQSNDKPTSQPAAQPATQTTTQPAAQSVLEQTAKPVVEPTSQSSTQQVTHRIESESKINNKLKVGDKVGEFIEDNNSTVGIKDTKSFKLVNMPEEPKDSIKSLRKSESKLPTRTNPRFMTDEELKEMYKSHPELDITKSSSKSLSPPSVHFAMPNGDVPPLFMPDGSPQELKFMEVKSRKVLSEDELDQ